MGSTGERVRDWCRSLGSGDLRKIPNLVRDIRMVSTRQIALYVSTISNELRVPVGVDEITMPNLGSPFLEKPLQLKMNR